MSLDNMQMFLFSYSCVSMAIYAFMVFTIIRQRRAYPVLKGSFFLLVVTYFVADFLLFLEFNIMMRGRKYGYLNFLFPEGSMSLYVVPRISNALHYYAKIVVYLGQVIFALNRFTAALRPLHYNSMWSSSLVLLIVAFQWILPLVAVLPVHLNMNFEMRYVLYADQNQLRLETDKESTEIIALVDMGCSLLCTLVSLFMYAGTLHYVRKGMQSSMVQNSNRIQSFELRLLISALIVFVVLSLNTFIQVMTVITNHQGMEKVMFINDLSYPILDLVYTCQPWALLISSSVMRDGMVSTLRCGGTHSPLPQSLPTDQISVKRGEPDAAQR